VDKRYKSLIACLVLLIALIITTLFIKIYFKPFLIIIIFYMLCKPIYKFVYKVIHNTRIASILTILVLNIILFCVIYYLSSSLLTKVCNFYYENSKKVYNFFNTLNPGPFLGTFNIDKLKNGILDESFIKRGAFYTGDGIISYLIANICLYFLLSDGDNLFSGILFFIPEKYWSKLKNTFSNLKDMVTIELMLVLFNTLEVFIGFKILNIRESFFLALLCGILDLLPYVGTIIVFIPLIIYNIVLKEYFVVIGLICLYLLILIVREILETKFIGNKLNLHPLIVLISIYVGMKLLGIIGIAVGPLYVLISKEILLDGT
jgi:predicted PurR-regulated permease PerM